jgi:hypothetical protein
VLDRLVVLLRCRPGHRAPAITRRWTGSLNPTSHTRTQRSVTSSFRKARDCRTHSIQRVKSVAAEGMSNGSRSSHGRPSSSQIARNHLDNVVQVFESDDIRWLGADQFRSYFQLNDLKFDDQHTL